MGMAEHELTRRTPSRTNTPVPVVPACEDPEDERLTVLPPIVWTAGIAGVVAVLLLSA